MSEKTVSYTPIYTFDIEFICGNSLKIKPVSFSELVKINNYHNNFLPMLTLTVEFTDNDIRNIRKFKTDLMCSIRCIIDGIDKRSKEHVYINDTFVSFFDETKLPDMVSEDSKIVEKVEDEGIPIETNYVGSGLAKDKKQSVVFYLFSMTSININKKLNNFILRNAEVSQSLAFLVSENKYVENVYLDNVENRTVYRNLMLPPLNLKQSIENLQILYGIYSSGLTIFFDNDILYILNRFLKKREPHDEKSLLTTLFVDERYNSVSSEQKVTIKEDGEFYHNAYNRADVKNNALIFGESQGDRYAYTNLEKILTSLLVEDGKVISNTNPMEELIRLNLSHEMTNTKTTYDYDGLNNHFLISSDLRETSSSIEVQINNILNVDPREFTPERTISLKISDSSRDKVYGGLKVIKEVAYHFKKTQDKSKKYTATCTAFIKLID